MIFLWIILYGLVHGACAAVQGAPWVLPLGMVTYTAGFLLWICRSGLYRLIRLNKVSHGFLWQLLPLFIPAAGNLILNGAAFPGWEAGLVLICVSITEELFFRGFLFQYLLKTGEKKALLGSSLLFSLMHLVNLAEGAELGYTLAQLLFSFWAGLCYALSVLRWKSLFPCIWAHVLTNLTATGTYGSFWVPLSASCTVIFFIYSWWLYIYLQNQKKEIVP